MLCFKGSGEILGEPLAAHERASDKNKRPWRKKIIAEETFTLPVLL